MSQLIDGLKRIPSNLWALTLDEGYVEKPLREYWYTAQTDNGNDGWKPLDGKVRTFKGSKAFQTTNQGNHWVVRRSLNDSSKITNEGALFWRTEYQDHLYWTTYSVQLWLPSEKRWSFEEQANESLLFKSGPQRFFEYLESEFNKRAKRSCLGAESAVQDYRIDARKRLS